MTTTLEEILAGFSPKRRAYIKREVKKLRAQQMALPGLRKELKMSQDQVADLLGIGQDCVSRLELRCDPRVSTLQKYMAVMGGRLKLVVELPDRPDIELVGLGAKPESAAGKKSRGSKPKKDGPGRTKRRRN